MEITGKLIEKGQIEEFGDKGFKVQKFKIDLTTYNQQNGQEYPNKAEFQVTGNNTEQMAAVQIGDKIKVEFAIEGRDVDKKDKSGKIFIQNLKAWKVSVVEQGVSATAPAELDPPF